MDDDIVPGSFEEAWAKYGGLWTVDWGDFTTVSGLKGPDKPRRPKLRLIQGGRKD